MEGTSVTTTLSPMVAQAAAAAQRAAAAFMAAQSAGTVLSSPVTADTSSMSASTSLPPSSSTSTAEKPVSVVPSKTTVNFVIPRNKLAMTKTGQTSGALVAVGHTSKWEPIEAKEAVEVKKVEEPESKKSRWGPEPLADPAVKRGRALALQTRIEQISSQFEQGTLELDMNEGTRSPSPPPIYGDNGQRLNTREGRKRELLEFERREAIGECLKLNPAFKAPAGYKPPLKDAKLFLPVKEHPGYNFIGLILGPRGNTQKMMEKETGAKIAIRGKGAQKDGKRPGREGKMLMEGANEELHVYICGDTLEKVDAAVALIEPLLTPVDESRNNHKRKQLQELAKMNGTVRDIFCSLCGEAGHREWLCPKEQVQTFNAKVMCGICGDGGHPSNDCPLRNTPSGATSAKAMDSEYAKFQAELFGGIAQEEEPKPAPSAASAPQSFPPAPSRPRPGLGFAQNGPPPPHHSQRPPMGHYDPAGGYGPPPPPPPQYGAPHGGGVSGPPGGWQGPPPPHYGGYQGGPPPSSLLPTPPPQGWTPGMGPAPPTNGQPGFMGGGERQGAYPPPPQYQQFGMGPGGAPMQGASGMARPPPPGSNGPWGPVGGQSFGQQAIGMAPGGQQRQGPPGGGFMAQPAQNGASGGFGAENVGQGPGFSGNPQFPGGQYPPESGGSSGPMGGMQMATGPQSQGGLPQPSPFPGDAASQHQHQQQQQQQHLQTREPGPPPDFHQRQPDGQFNQEANQSKDPQFGGEGSSFPFGGVPGGATGPPPFMVPQPASFSQQGQQQQPLQQQNQRQQGQEPPPQQQHFQFPPLPLPPQSIPPQQPPPPPPPQQQQQQQHSQQPHLGQPHLEEKRAEQHLPSPSPGAGDAPPGPAFVLPSPSSASRGAPPSGPPAFPLGPGGSSSSRPPFPFPGAPPPPQEWSSSPNANQRGHQQQQHFPHEFPASTQPPPLPPSGTGPPPPPPPTSEYDPTAPSNEDSTNATSGRPSFLPPSGTPQVFGRNPPFLGTNQSFPPPFDPSQKSSPGSFQARPPPFSSSQAETRSPYPNPSTGLPPSMGSGRPPSMPARAGQSQHYPNQPPPSAPFPSFPPKASPPIGAAPSVGNYPAQQGGSAVEREGSSSQPHPPFLGGGPIAPLSNPSQRPGGSGPYFPSQQQQRFPPPQGPRPPPSSSPWSNGQSYDPFAPTADGPDGGKPGGPGGSARNMGGPPPFGMHHPGGMPGQPGQSFNQPPQNFHDLRQPFPSFDGAPMRPAMPMAGGFSSQGGRPPAFPPKQQQQQFPSSGNSAGGGSGWPGRPPLPQGLTEKQDSDYEKLMESMGVS